MDKLPFFNALILLQSFETYWAYYSVSDGKLYAEACYKSALSVAESLWELNLLHGEILDPSALKLDENIDPKDMLKHIETWAKNSSNAPFDDIATSIRKLSLFLSALKSLLLEICQVEVLPFVQMNREELMYREGVVRWQAHLPTMVIMGSENPEALLKRASASQSVVVSADIKKIRNLILYANDKESYSSFIVEFIERTKMFVDEYMGIFGHFNGDGFTAYFNKSVCEIISLDMLDCFVNFARDEMAFANDLFIRWSKTIRTLPPDAIGISIGADIGFVDFKDLGSQLVAIGEPLSWSLHLAKTGKTGDVILNNLLYSALENNKNITFEEQVNETSSGEKYVVRRLII